MKYGYKLRTRYPFAEFCKDLKTEIGETLFEICNPTIIKNDIVSINIPDSNHKRISETLNYGSCNCTPICTRISQ